MRMSVDVEEPEIGQGHALVDFETTIVGAIALLWRCKRALGAHYERGDVRAHIDLIIITRFCAEVPVEA
jgi:hypothetical protein